MLNLKKKSTETPQRQKQLKPVLLKILMELTQATRISKHWTKKSMQTLEVIKGQEVPSPRTLLMLMILAANTARRWGMANQAKMNGHRDVHPEISTDGGTKLIWFGAVQISRASSRKAIKVELEVWSYWEPLHPTVQEAQVITIKVYPAKSKAGLQLGPNAVEQINE